MLRRLKTQVKEYLSRGEFTCLRQAVIELNTVQELKLLFRWEDEPILDDLTIYDFEVIEDLNERRIRDADSLGTIMRNIKPQACLDIGTSTGHSAALMAVNAPHAQIYTINIPAEEIIAGMGGTLTTAAYTRDEIGSYYRERKLTNITQIFANTATWQPDIGKLDLVYIDGCHDTEFVINDTLKILPYMRPGGFILWHDFNPSLVYQYVWIHAVCQGIEQLLARDAIRGRIFHIRDSWVGIYRLPI